MNSRSLTVGEPDEPHLTVMARRCWRCAGVLWHLLAGAVELLWRRAGRDPHSPAIAAAKQRWCRRLLDIMGVELRVHGLARSGPVLLVSNHVSWLDIPVICAARPCDCLSKAEVSGWPLIGWIARSVGTLFIRRGAGEAHAKVAEMRARLHQGRALLLFPEGTTSDGTGVRRFLPPLLAVAEATPVQPVAIRYRDPSGCPDTRLAFLGDDDIHRHLWRLLGRRRIAVDLTFTVPLPPATPRALAIAARQQILNTLNG